MIHQFCLKYVAATTISSLIVVYSFGQQHLSAQGEASIPNFDILRALTSNPARLMEMETQRGRMP
jgi:hypothetical protein